MPPITLDANALIHYTRERALRDNGLPPTGRSADAARRHMGRAIGERRAFAPQTAYDEASRHLHRDLKDNLDRSTLALVGDYAHDLLDRRLAGVAIADRLDYVEDARAMYASIAGDPSDPRLAEWSRIKGRHRDAPRLGPGRNDLVILSTAAYYARSGSAELWTHDADFTVFAGEIRDRFGVEVVDTRRLGERFA